MKSKKNKEKLENSVKLFFHSAEHCYIIYSPSKKLSKEAKFVPLDVGKVKARFGFELLCDDLPKSVKEAEKFRLEQNISAKFPKSLADIESYGIEGNTLNLFVLHKTSTKMGYGISTYSALKKGVVVAEYVGERKSSDTKTADSTYLLLNNDGTDIDAKDYGNVARFFNHCPNEHSNKQVMTANLAIVPWPVSENLTKVFFVTLRDIKAFEPLCWDYGDKYGFEDNIELLNGKTYLPMNMDEL